MSIEYDALPLWAQHALAWTALGVPVFPVHHMVKDLNDGTLECSCQRWERKRAREYGEEPLACTTPGKHPRVAWTKRRTVSPEQIMRWARKFPRANLGIATGNGLAVVDIDGDEGRDNLVKLVSEHGPLPDTVTNRTGSGGTHYYFRVPEGVVVKNSASKLAPKIDIRGDGGYVVGAGSNHCSGGTYEYVAGHALGEIEIAMAPQWLIDLIAEKPKGSPPPKGGGRGKGREPHAAAETPRNSAAAADGHGVEHYLALIGDAEGGMGFDKPIYQAMCSFFSREGPEAEAETLKQTIIAAVDAAYEDPAKPRKDRYRSDEYLDEQIEKARAFIAEAGDQKKRKPDDFTFDSVDACVEALNENNALIIAGGRAVYLWERGHDVDLLTKQAFMDLRAPWKILTEDKPISGALAWLNSPDRRTYERIVFEPEKDIPGAYNLWKGFPLKPERGSWERMKAHLLNGVCRGNADYYEWLFGWLAQMLQQPGRKTGTAIVFFGGKGTGKSTVIRWLKKILGDYAVVVDQAHQFLGNFNGHLERCLLLVSEESFWAGNKEAEGTLKNLITGETRMLERKGIDAVQVSNHTRFMVATNAEWAVKATGDERRFFVLEVSDAFAQDRDYFGALEEEFQNGGPAAMMEELLRFDFSHLDLRNPPGTDALRRQIEASLEPPLRWLYNVLESGDFEDETGESGDHVLDNWLTTPVEINADVVCRSFNVFVRGIKGRPVAVAEVTKFLKGAIAGFESDRGRRGGERVRLYRFPALRDLRREFTLAHQLVFSDDAAADARDVVEIVAPTLQGPDTAEVSDLTR